MAPLAVVALAACGGSGGGESDSEQGSPPIPGAPTIEVVGDNLRFFPDRLFVDVERFNIAFTSEDVFHTFVIEDANGDLDVAGAAAGDTDRGGVELEPGEYVFFCDVPGHRAGGMEGTLVVQE